MIGNRKCDSDMVYFEDEATGAKIVSKAFFDTQVQGRPRDDLEREGLLNVTV